MAGMSMPVENQEGLAEYAVRWNWVPDPSRFVPSRPGQPEVARVFRYDRVALLVDFLCEKVAQERLAGAVVISIRGM